MSRWQYLAKFPLPLGQIAAPPEADIDQHWAAAFRPPGQPVLPPARQPIGSVFPVELAEVLPVAESDIDQHWAAAFRPPSQPVLPARRRPPESPPWLPPDMDTVLVPRRMGWFRPPSQPLILPRRLAAALHPECEPNPFRGRYYLDARGKYRVFGAAEYRFYRSNSAPPAEGDSPYATSSTLPHEPADAFADGTWYLSVSWFNGVLDSGFLPLGDGGETYLRLDLSGGEEVTSPPAGPLDWRLELRPSGVVRVHGLYWQTGTLRADTWAIAYTVNGSTPAAGSPDVTEAIAAVGMAVLSYDLPAQANGTTVKVRLQTRRDSSYSEDSTVNTATADAAGPAAPPAGDRWPGNLPEDL